MPMMYQLQLLVQQRRLKVWGIGDNTAALLNKYGVRTALDIARKQELWVKKFVTKPFYEIWQELNG